MNEIMKELDEAYKLLGAISVAGDAVDVMAGAKGHIRRAYKLAAPPEELQNRSEVESNG